MAKIILGKKYDASTAERVASWDVPDDVTCTLYRKRNGEFFLAWWCPSRGEVYRPLSDGAARAYCEVYLDADVYEELFGEVDE